MQATAPTTVGNGSIATSPSGPRSLVWLTFADGEIVITPRDRSAFLIQAKKAAEARRQVVQLEEGIKQFESNLLKPLHEWCLANADRVKACYLPMPGNHIKVFIVPSSPRFDYDLGAKVAELELNLARGGWRISVTQLPVADDESSLTTFFNHDGALQVYAQRRPAS